MFKVRKWERFQFLIGYEHLQVKFAFSKKIHSSLWDNIVQINLWLCQHKTILERSLPEYLKLSIAKKIENNLFSKVLPFAFFKWKTSKWMAWLQITFLVGLYEIGEIRTQFAAEVCILYDWIIYFTKALFFLTPSSRVSPNNVCCQLVSKCFVYFRNWKV